MESARTFLNQIVTPNDLKKFSDRELVEVANEVRQAILDQVSKTGGHFSSNLGTVELTVALYAAYDIPPDKVVWDTGHQAYPHKILTGRLPEFPTLRNHGGISGFLRRSEHPLDVFGAGHAGTAISAAVGFAAARDQLGTGEKVVAITGDAAIASGMSWEALNHAGDMGTDVAVVLNDNRMSIAPNVGALTNYLAKLRSRPQLQHIARRAKSAVEQMPEAIHRVAAGLRHGITHYLAPEETGTVFEEIGWEYIGPVDGHDVPTLLEIFRNIRELNYPVFVHALTVKGKGYVAAEGDARKWHGVTPFDLEKCEMAKGGSSSTTFTQAFGAEMVALAKADPAIVAITAAMPDGTGLNDFAKELPSRYYDVGIAESHAVTLAAGMAAGGLKPFCVVYSTFLQRGFDQILHDVALQRLPVRFALDRAGLVGDDGPTHHGTYDLSYLGLIPGMTILAPRDTTELREMMAWMARYDAGPTAVRYPRGVGDDALPESRTPIELGRAERIGPWHDRADLAIAAIGSMVASAAEVARQLAQEGVRVNVLNARFMAPLDESGHAELFATAPAVMLAEENVRAGGYGATVRDRLFEALSGKRVDVAAIPDVYVEHGTQAILRHEVGLSAAALLARARAVMSAGVGSNRG
ncbi:MAG: 1-deoxy-D-xylulose-5-phosphate synthase [Fimbriimonadaceae bacterium]|nr:1-deoxy-D-xylulose-5-phosphate synthase [Fimbriimonadaceae bacterium]